MGEISRKLGVSKSTVHWHVGEMSLTNQQREQLRAKKRLRMAQVNALRRGVPIRPITFNRPSWSLEFVHLMSHLNFDGRVDRFGCMYYSRTETQARHVQTLLNDVIGVQAAIRQRTNGIWVVSCYNVVLAAWLIRKESELLGVVERKQSWRRAWLQALFDDEGHVFVSHSKRRVRASQKDAGVLRQAQYFLKLLRIESRIDLRAQAVEITGRSNLQQFSRCINFSPDLMINPLRKNGVRHQPTGKRALLHLALTSYISPAVL